MDHWISEHCDTKLSRMSRCNISCWLTSVCNVGLRMSGLCRVCVCVSETKKKKT